MSHETDKATTGVVAVVRPESTRIGSLRIRSTRTQAPVFAAVNGFVALNEGMGLTFVGRTTDSPLARKAVITQDPYHPVSGRQFWSHPPV